MPNISTPPQAHPAYPDFDDTFRKHSASVLSTETELATYISSTEVLSAESIKDLFQKLQKEHKDFGKFVESINAHYKMVKRVLAVTSEKEARAKEEKKHAVEKAKEYKAKIKTLEQKLASQGTSVEDISRWYAQERKRKRDEDNGDQALPPLKISNPRTKASCIAQVTPTAAKQQESTPPRASPSNSASNSSFKIPMTPVPRAKKTDFTKHIPRLTKHAFVTKRLSRPNPLAASGDSSQITAVLQGLCASMKAHEAWQDLPKDDEKSSQFVDYMAQMQHPCSNPLVVSRLQRLFGTVQDPVKYLHQVLSTIRSPYIENAYEVRTDHRITCPTCANDCQIKQSHEKNWTLSLSPHFTDSEMRYKGVISRDLLQLLREKTWLPEYINCPGDFGFQYNKHNARKHFLGLAYAPENIVFTFEQKKRCRIFLPLEQDFKDVVRASAQKTKYRLVTVVKKMKSGMFAAFVHAEDGKWWRTVGEVVKEVQIEEWQGERGGDLVMAFYEQLD